MLKKRLVGVVTIKDGWAVQSMGYKRYLPLGKPECLVENLDRWGADEILVQVIDRTKCDEGPDFELLDKLARLGLATPLIYSGGIRSVDDGVRAIQSGADRLALDALLHDDPALVLALSDRLGAQAIIAALPVTIDSGNIKWLDYRNGHLTALSSEVVELVEAGAVSEVLLIDWVHEGFPLGFNQGLIGAFPLRHVPLIVFGGISGAAQMKPLLQSDSVAAVAVGNFLNYREHELQKLKFALAAMPLRPPIFESKYSSFLND